MSTLSSHVNAAIGLDVGSSAFFAADDGHDGDW